MKQTKAVEFVEENLKTIFAYALSRVSNKEDAEDLTNDIVLAVLQSADRIQNPDAFYGYIWGIAANTYRSFLRKKCRFSFEEVGEDIADEIDFAAEMIAREDNIKLHREIALLSKEYRECTVAYYYDELSCAEVSDKLDISLEMVKYYLFKTRKILKEGICMEREFGEKSFRPAPFELMTIFSGSLNREYQNLFSRKLPGQILLSAYYTPMTIRELAIELGVGSVYLEDEIAVLEKYDLITKTSAVGKYQTKLVIFTENFTKEFYRQAEKFSVTALNQIITSIRRKLLQIRELNAICRRLSDNRLLWGVLWPVMRLGFEQFESKYPAFQERDKLYDGATGTKYGISCDAENPEYSSGSLAGYSCGAFAGFAKIDDEYYASAADFGVLADRNKYFVNQDSAAFREKIHRIVSGNMEPEFMILSEADECKLYDILSEEAVLMAELYDQLFSCTCKSLRIHAPVSVSGQIERIAFQTLFFRTVGLIGGCAVKSVALPLPDFDGPAAIYVCENTKEAEAGAKRNVLI